MSVTTNYPGVYIQELQNPIHTISGVSTSITAFIGSAPRGPIDTATLIHSFAEYTRLFGGLSKSNKMSYAVYHYFLNGGTDAIIIRVVNGANETTFTITGSTLKLQAVYPGDWANKLKINIDSNVDISNSSRLGQDQGSDLFNLHISDDTFMIKEDYFNLSVDKDNSKFVTNILLADSQLLNVADGSAMPTKAPPVSTTEGKQPAITIKDNTKDTGSNGDFPTKAQILGDPVKKTGLYALDNVDIFNILCIPPYGKDEESASEVYADAYTYCENKRAILIVDPPKSWINKKIPQDEIDTKAGLTRGKNAAIFFPRINAPDPLDENRLHTFVPCGAVAGVIARTDSERGVWKTAAGIDAALRGVSELSVKLTDPENGELNPLGINCLRSFPSVGPVVWGSRTMRGADVLTDQWKYLAVRRTALYIEESLYRSTKWVVFEPNDEGLWSQIRLNIGAFMHDLFRKGAFQGTNPKDAYLVKCDKETTTQYDIDRGIVNILVGFAPLKPAEFVIIQIQQLAGQVEV